MFEEFEWDPPKAAANLRKHGVSFGEAATVFGDPLAVEPADEFHSVEEQRYLCLGRSYLGRFIVVAYTERPGRLRIISARPATPRERRDYERGRS